MLTPHGTVSAGPSFPKLQMHGSELNSSFCSDNSSVQQLPFFTANWTNCAIGRHTVSVHHSACVKMLCKTIVPSTGCMMQKQKELSMTLIACIVNAQLAVWFDLSRIWKWIKPKRSAPIPLCGLETRPERLVPCFCLHTCLTLVLNNGWMENKPYLRRAF